MGAPPPSISELQVEGFLGDGSAGKVFMARRRHPLSGGSEHVSVEEDAFALKCVPKTSRGGWSNALSAARERAALTDGAAGHPALPQLVGAFQDGRQLFFVLELVHGVTLADTLHEVRRLEPESCAMYCAMLAAALAHLHARGWAHRDVKPDNVLVNRQGFLHLIDFGNARRVGDGERAYTLCGTPEYIAPEVLQGLGHGVEVDWWSLGILVYETIVGTPPFCAETPIDVYGLALSAELELPEWMPEPAQALVSALLEREPHKRLGFGGGLADIADAPFMAGVDWEALHSRRATTPIEPVVPSAAQVELAEIEALLESPRRVGQEDDRGDDVLLRDFVRCGDVGRDGASVDLVAHDGKRLPRAWGAI